VRLRPDGAIEILLNSGLAADRVHNFLSTQIARVLGGIRLPKAEAVFVDGYAYWSSENTHNPFVTGVASGASPVYACVAAKSMSFVSAELFYYADASVPFVVAEQHGGIRAAQALMSEIVDRGEGVEGLHDRVRAACDDFTASFTPPPEILIEPLAGRSDLSDDRPARQALDDAKARTGLDAYGRPFVIRYTVLPSGQLSTTDYTTAGRTIVIVSPQMSAEERRAALIFAFAGSFLYIHYEGISPTLVYGYSDWAARDQTNPFIGGAHGTDTPKSLCDYLPQADFAQSSTKGAVWLSALPFVMEEQRSAAAGANALLTELVSQRSLDLAAWRSRVAASCASFLASGGRP